jgi:hypothetical protein
MSLAGRRHRLTRLTSAPFRVRAPGPVSGQLCGTRPGGRPEVVPVSCCLSATGVRFLGVLFPLGISLPHGRPTGLSLRGDDRTISGFPRSTRMRDDRVGCPYYPGTAVLSRPTLNHRPSPAASQRPVLHPGAASHLPGLNVTGHEGIHSHSPQPVFPSPVTPGWNTGPWASSLSFAPHRYQRRTSGRGRAFEHSPGLCSQHHLLVLQSAYPLIACDLVSHLCRVVREPDREIGREPQKLVLVFL